MSTALSPAPGELVFRDALGSDAAAVVALVESAYRDPSHTGWTTEIDIVRGQRTDLRGVLDVIEAPGSRLVLVERAGRLVACCQLERRGTRAYFGMFAVSPALQGAGLGKAVLAEAERFCRAEWGAQEMELTVISARTDLVAWYERRGYRHSGVTTPFPYGDERFGIPQRPDLAFAQLVKPLG